METMTMATTLVILAGALAFVGWPLANPAMAEEEETARERRREALEEEKDRVFGALSDLDHDRQTGKMEENDFDAISLRLKVDAARVLRDIDVNEGRKVLREGESRDAAKPADDAKPAKSAKKTKANVPPPRQDDDTTVPGLKPRSLDGLADVSGASALEGAGAFCTKCGRRAKAADDRFCGRCGATLPEDV